MPPGESPSHVSAFREVLTGYARGALDPAGLRTALKRLDQLWLARIRGGWRHEKGEAGERLLVVGLDANSLAFFGDPVATSVNEALLPVFAGADGVLLDPRGPHPTTLRLAEIYGVTGIPGVVAYDGVALRARTHGEVHVYLDGLGWPAGWRGHRLVRAEGGEHNEYSTPSAPAGAPSLVRFIVDDPRACDDFGLDTSQLLDAVAWRVTADLEREAIARERGRWLLAEAERLHARAKRVESMLHEARLSTLREVRPFTPLSRLAAELAPDRSSLAALDREIAAARAKCAELAAVVARERDMGDPFEQRAEQLRVRMFTQGYVHDAASTDAASTDAASHDAILARAHLVERSEHGPVVCVALQELTLWACALPYGAEHPLDVLSALSRAALVALRSEDLLVVEGAFDLVRQLNRQPHEPLRDGLLALVHHRDHVHFEARVLDAVYFMPDSDVHAATQDLFTQTLESEEPRLLALALRGVGTPTKSAQRRATALLAHESPTVRSRALVLLGHGDDPGSVAAVARLLDDEQVVPGEPHYDWLGTSATSAGSHPVRASAVLALGSLSRLTRTEFHVPLGFADTPNSVEHWVGEAKRWYQSERIWL